MAVQGRPRSLDDAKRREICALISAGDSLRGAARYVGCSVATIRREAKRNPNFDQRLRHAEGAARLAPLQAMRKAASTHWRAAAWMLERTDPERFGRRRPNSFGRKELDALTRDLLRIFCDEVDHPFVRERIEGRMRTAINYATRHAWDERRSGPALRRAIEFFERKRQDEDWWGLSDQPYDNQSPKYGDAASEEELAEGPEEEREEGEVGDASPECGSDDAADAVGQGDGEGADATGQGAEEAADVTEQGDDDVSSREEVSSREPQGETNVVECKDVADRSSGREKGGDGGDDEGGGAIDPVSSPPAPRRTTKEDFVAALRARLIEIQRQHDARAGKTSKNKGRKKKRTGQEGRSFGARSEGSAGDRKAG